MANPRNAPYQGPQRAEFANVWDEGHWQDTLAEQSQRAASSAYLLNQLATLPDNPEQYARLRHMFGSRIGPRGLIPKFAESEYTSTALLDNYRAKRGLLADDPATYRTSPPAPTWFGMSKSGSSGTTFTTSGGEKRVTVGTDLEQILPFGTLGSLSQVNRGLNTLQHEYSHASNRDNDWITPDYDAAVRSSAKDIENNWPPPAPNTPSAQRTYFFDGHEYGARAAGDPKRRDHIFMATMDRKLASGLPLTPEQYVHYKAVEERDVTQGQQRMRDIELWLKYYTQQNMLHPYTDDNLAEFNEWRNAR